MKKYLKDISLCQKHTEPLDLICLDQQCQLRGIICAHCQKQLHSHSVQSLTVVLANISRDCESASDSLALLSKIDNIYSQTLQEAGRIKQEKDSLLLQETITHYYQKIGLNLRKKQYETQKFMKDLSGMNSKTISQFLCSYEFVNKQDNKQNLSNLQFFIFSQLQNFETNFQKLKQGIENQDPMDKMLNIFVQRKNTTYFFTSQKMHKQIILVSPTQVRIKDGYSYRIALLDPPIKKQNGKIKKKSCTFKIGKIGAMIGVGISYRKKVQDLQYIFSSYSQHGCYFVANNGYTYNQSNSTYNSLIKNWTFTTDDIITVTIFPQDKKITFFKQGNDLFQYSFEQKKQLEMNFAVMMCSNNESIQVVNR